MKKRIIAIFLTLIGTIGLCTAANTLQLSSSQGHPGDTVTLTLSMNNSDAVVALQAMIPLHGQLMFVPSSCVLTERGSSHYVSATVLHDTLRIYSYSLSLTPYSGNSGALLSFKVILKNEPATYMLPLCSAMLSSASGASLNVSTTAGAVTILAPKIALSTSSINYGHIPIRSTYSENVTVRNIGNEPLIISGISFTDSTLSSFGVVQTIPAGGETTLEIQYAPMLAGAITRQAVIHSNAHVGDSVLSILADPFSVNELRPLPASGETDSIVTVSLRMNNMDSIVGLQTAILLPSALTYVQGSFTVAADRSQGHTATAGMLGDTLVMLITNLENRPLHGGDGVVATFQLRLHGYGYYWLNLIQTALSDATGQNVLSAVYDDGVEIYSPSINCSGTLGFGSTPVTETAQASLPINNYGNATLLIQQVVFTDGDFSLVTPLPVTVSSWQSRNLTVAYTGTQESAHSATMNIYSNDPFHPLIQVTLNANRYEPNFLTVSADANAPVEDAAVDIVLDNYSEITAIQMDVVYPKNHYTMTANDIHLTGRANGHVVSAAAQNDSTLRVLILSMQNQPFSGNSGAVAHINLHAVDSTDEEHYPLRLNNVLTGGPDGLDRLTSYDSVVYIATRTIHDTTYIPIHDTTYVDVHDTTYIDVHDTTYVDVPYPVHDTTYVDVFVPVHDTTYIDVPYPVHDTTFITLTDTMFVTLYDTTYLTLHDTVTVTEQLTWFTLQVTSEDMEKGLAAGSGQFPEGTAVEIAAVAIEGNRFLQWNDGSQENPRTVTLTGDILLTAQFTTVGVEDYPKPDWFVYPEQNTLVVKGAGGHQVSVYDAAGRLLHRYSDAPDILRYSVPASGTYFIQVNNGAAKKVAVVRKS